ncbi:MAG: leucine-rich repeat protein [Eubacterium sp.]|nr:leucine-rich repeat protein [Eubacterium sp.]
MKYLKKILIIIVALTVAVINVPIESLLADERPGYYHYTITDGEVTITEYGGTDAEVEIPKNIDGYPVTKIGRNAFYKNNTIKKVVLPETLTEIEENAFYSCSIEEITISENVKKIGWAAFFECSGLKTVNYNAISLESEIYGFFKCDSIENIYIGSRVKKLPKDLFEKTAAKELTIPEGVEVIEKYFLGRSDGLETVYFNAKNLNDCECWDEYTKKMKDYNPFILYGNLKSVIVGNKVEVLSKNVFGRTTLEQIILPDSLKEIRTGALQSCRNLKKIIIPKNVKEIHKNALSSCNPYVIEIHNPTCTIYDDWGTLGDGGVIVGYNNSTAHDFATSKYRKFISFESKNYIKKSISLQVGEELSGKNTILSESDTFQVLSNYQSDKKEIATVDDTGTICGVAPGKTIVVMTDDKKTVMAILEVEVTEKQPEEETTTASEKLTEKEETTAEEASREVSTKKNIVLKKSKILKIQAKKKTLKIRWRKVSGISGYQLQYSRYKSFKKKNTIAIGKAKKTSKTIKNLKQNKKYYVRIRTYKKIGEKRFKSAWSKTKVKRTK